MGKASQPAKREVIKHSAAIQIENNITLLQRRTWNALLYNAYSELETKEEHSIPVKKLARLVGYDSHDMGYLKEAALAMLRCIVQYNVLGKDGSSERWGAMALLAQVDIQKGWFTYAYSPELRRRLHNPAMYARLDLNMQKQFDSKHALALWELCADYLGSGRDYGESPFIPLAEYRKLMGIADDMYPLFKLFNKRIIKEPIAEINRVSDFLVSVNYQRSGRGARPPARWITARDFCWKPYAITTPILSIRWKNSVRRIGRTNRPSANGRNRPRLSPSKKTISNKPATKS